jgi:hypothetical protein
MSELAGLERGYRRLLACYPQPFRREQADEVLAVLMAGARQGQRRPSLAEAADVLKSALRMRLRPAAWGPGTGPWADGMALFSVAAPLLLLAAAVLEVALPYRPPQTAPVARVFGSNFQIGGLPLFHLPGFGIAVAGLVVIAALVLLGMRWVALAAITASAVYWFVASYWIPEPLQVLSTSVFLLEAAALVASPGPRRGRALMTWRQGTVLLVAAAAVQVSTLWYEAASPPVGVLTGGSPATVYLVASVVLAVAAAGLAVASKMYRYFLLLLAAMFYPYVLQLAFPASSSSSDLIGHPTPAHLAVLYLPPLLAACAVLLTAAMPLRSRVAGSADPDKPRLT